MPPEETEEERKKRQEEARRKRQAGPTRVGPKKKKTANDGPNKLPTSKFHLALI